MGLRRLPSGADNETSAHIYVYVVVAVDRINIIWRACDFIIINLDLYSIMYIVEHSIEKIINYSNNTNISRYLTSVE